MRSAMPSWRAVAEIVQPMRDLPSTEVGGQHGFDGTFGARRRKRNRVVKLSTTLTIHKKLSGNLCGMAPICASLAHGAIKSFHLPISGDFYPSQETSYEDHSNADLRRCASVRGHCSFLRRHPWGA